MGLIEDFFQCILAMIDEITDKIDHASERLMRYWIKRKGYPHRTPLQKQTKQRH